MRALLRMMVLSAALPALADDAHAAATKMFRHTTAKDFEEGEASGSMILPSGEVVAGMKAKHVPLEAAFVWCSALSPDGAVAYFGTGDEGKIYAVDTRGAGADGKGAARRVADLDAAWVTALAVRADGTLLAGTTPGGRIYVVDPKTKSAKELATLPADHVWSLVHDAKSGTTYAGTGSPGKIFAVDAKGKARPLWDSTDKHIVSLLATADGRLLAGTSEEAILYRVSMDGKAEALQDFEAEEVRAIARAGDDIYVAVNEFEKAGPVGGAAPGPAAAKGTRITLGTSGAPASAGALPRPGQRKSKAGLYRLDRAGQIEQIFSLPEGYFTSLILDESGGAYLATGTQGKVYQVMKDRTVALAIDLPERQALTLVRAAGSFLVGTGDVGGVYRAQPAGGDGASYLSKVLDAEFPGRWGMLRWHGSKDLTFETRSGNTAKPDATWTGWKRLDRQQSTVEGGAGHVASPAARYVQYRVSLGGPSGRVRDVSLYYLPQNQRPRVLEITTADAPAAVTTTAPASATVAARVHSALLKLRWRVENSDNDDLTYRLWFRDENEAVWRPLGGPEPLTKTEFDWNTEGLPDGNYVVRVTVSDERSNPRERALDSTLDSVPMLVDNRKPEVIGLEVRYPIVAGRARDMASNITELEYSVDGGEWKAIAPGDGICDDLVEAFTFRLPALSAGPHAVTVRAWDAADNVGAGGVTVRVK